MGIGARALSVQWVGVGTVLLNAACGMEQCPKVGAFEDARFPQLCVGDRLALSPTSGDLGPGVGILSDAGVSSGTLLQMGLSGTDPHGHPREAVHIEVNVEGGNRARLEASDRCQLRTDTHLHCQLGVDGQASFGLRYVERGAYPGPTDSNADVLVKATSNDHEATSTVRIHAIDQLGLRIAPLSGELGSDNTLYAFAGLRDSPLSLDCGAEGTPLPTLSPACSSLYRRVRLEATVVDRNEGTREVEPLVATRARISMTRGVPYGFLTADSGACPVGVGASSLVLDFERGVSKQQLSLCVDRRAESYVLEGTLQDGGDSEPLLVRAEPSPVGVVLRGRVVEEYRTCDAVSPSEVDAEGLLEVTGAAEAELPQLELKDRGGQRVRCQAGVPTL